MTDLKRCAFRLFFLTLFALPFAALIVHADASVPANAVVLIGDNANLPDADVLTAAMLVYDELRKHGISVSEPVWEAPASANVYRIVMRPLGTKIFVRLSEEKPAGTIVEERQIMLAGIEEMVSAAPRLVDALVGRKPIESTIDMETVTEQDAPVRRKISGESLWHVGILGTSIPGTDIIAEPGFAFGWNYETPSFAVGTEYRVSGRDVDYDDEGDGFSFLSWSIGGRYFFNKQNISPYVGGGFAIVNASYETNDETNWQNNDYGPRYDDYHYYNYDSEDDMGLGAYVVAGIELLRLTESRLNLELRVDRPFFSLPSQDMMPITIGISFSRNYVPGASCLF
ncbi:MAG: hypothetical protein OXT74_04430 [Candidatus Poribacteria bacterium]|nr:hypothetical protein [Candidatus Poribacteria bacterium]